MLRSPVWSRAALLAALCSAGSAGAASGQMKCPDSSEWNERVTRLAIQLSSSRISVGDTVTARVMGYDHRGLPCRPRTIPFSSNVNVARMIRGGRIVGVAPGVAIIRAELTVAQQDPYSRWAVLAATAVVAVVPAGAQTAVVPGQPQGQVFPVPQGGPPMPSAPPGMAEQPVPGRYPPDVPPGRQVVVFLFEVDPVRPTSDSAWLEQGVLLVGRLDLAARRLADVFRNSAGVPIAGAESPALLSGRERFRWAVCRQIVAALGSHARAAHELSAAPLRLARGAKASQAAQALEQALRGTDALRACEGLARMMEARGQVRDWESAYTSAATRFYAGWYAELRGAHEAARALGQAVRSLLPPERAFDVPPVLPPTPPTIGGQ